jgi:2-C-methyl-D-erythritol 4-phosphate cytidylyltransferase/2-C-methyl-D-erythritol 2,4-cyclodiphosphate synthase
MAVPTAAPSTVPTTAVIVVAAGSGTRLGHSEPKAFAPLAGRTILEHALDSVLGMAEPVQLVVVVPESRLSVANDVVARSAVADAIVTEVTVLAGGATRQASVAIGLAALKPAIDVVLVHDAARPLTPSRIFDDVASRVRSDGGGHVPSIAIADTIKRVQDGEIVETVDRSKLVAVQTPQGFPRQLLEAAYASAIDDHTDDAAVFAAAGHPVLPAAGDPLSFKITTAWDLRRAERLLAEQAGPATISRTGIGIDVHAYDDATPLWLGGVYWPNEPGLDGHSDGDAISHAMCDALLSAAGLGDIGSRFGTDDPRFAGAHGEVFLRETVTLVEGAGFAIQNVAVQVVANHPKLAARRSELEQRLTEIVGAPVSVSATTSDGLGFTGRGEGLSAIATALLTA